MPETQKQLREVTDDDRIRDWMERRIKLHDELNSVEAIDGFRFEECADFEKKISMYDHKTLARMAVVTGNSITVEKVNDTDMPFEAWFKYKGYKFSTMLLAKTKTVLEPDWD